MSDELELLKRRRPAVEPPSPEARRRAEHALHAVIADAEGRHPSRLRAPMRVGLARLAPVAAVLVVIAVALLFLGGHNRRPAGSPGLTGPELTFSARPIGPVRRVNVGVVAQAASLLQQLVLSLPGEQGGVSVTNVGQRVVVHLGRDTRLSRPELLSLVGMTGRLVFYDWEADALTPGDQPVAARLAWHDQGALLISQGGGSEAPGSSGAGSLPLYQAVSVASRQSVWAGADVGRPGPQYFAFGAPGSPDCEAAASYYGVRLVPKTHCYLAGPAPTAAQTLAALPPSVSPREVETLMVPQGTVVLQAVPANFARRPAFIDPRAQFYVLRDQVGLFGSAVTKPTPSTDQAGSPDVNFQFTAKGAAAFQAMTARVAHRGDLVSGLGQTFNQHFAVALGDQLITVPSIDFKTYPDGVAGNGGADVTGGFTSRSVQVASTEMRLGALPVTLELLSGSPG